MVSPAVTPFESLLEVERSRGVYATGAVRCSCRLRRSSCCLRHPYRVMPQDSPDVGGVELSLKAGQVCGRGFGALFGRLFGDAVPPGVGFGEAGGGPGGRVGGDVQQRVGCPVGGPAAARLRCRETGFRQCGEEPR